MPDVLMVADTIRSPELRHEVPLAVPDPFIYVEREGVKHMVAASMELVRLPAVAPEIVAHPLEELGSDELYAQGLSMEEIQLELVLRACRELGVDAAVVPATFPLRDADFLRDKGIELTVDQAFFDGRRRSKSEAEIEGIRRAQRAAEAGMAAGIDLLRRAERNGAGLVVDGDPLTCELIKLHAERAFGAHGATAEEFIASHGAQTAVGHDMGSGQIEPGDVVLFDFFPRDRESGCYADMTRTFVVGGEPDEEIRGYHRLAKEALERCAEAIKPGLSGKDLHTMVCEFFHEHGHPTQLHKEQGQVLDSGFYHATGHGVGLEVHEKPNIGRTGQPFVPGDVLAIEPGLYRAGYGGVRLEDLILVTEDGAEVLTDFPYDLEL
ncbi:MAG TPA: Xaa-Pro peptidase family protein [Gaiellaceae bacterium]|nr:Xaa-Pro peptidase family protein [Gaiellaceae bacterium]